MAINGDFDRGAYAARGEGYHHFVGDPNEDLSDYQLFPRVISPLEMEVNYWIGPVIGLGRVIYSVTMVGLGLLGMLAESVQKLVRDRYWE